MTDRPESYTIGKLLQAARLEQAIRELAAAANNFLQLTVAEPVSGTHAWRALSGAVTRALEAANAKAIEAHILTVEKSPSGLWFVTGLHKGLMVTGHTLGEALGRVEIAWDELQQADQEYARAKAP